MNQRSDIVERLMAYRRDELSDSDRQDLEAMLESDGDLRDLQALLDRMDDLKQEERDDPAAQAAHMLAMQLFGDWLLQRRKESLRKKPDHPGETGAVRAIGAERAPQFTFELAGGELAVNVLPINDEQCELIGQIDGITPCPRFVECICGNRRITADIDEYGMFRFASIPSGQLTLSVTLAEDRQASIHFHA